MKKPVLTFTSIAALAAAALGGTIYWKNMQLAAIDVAAQKPAEIAQVKEPEKAAEPVAAAEPAKAPEVEKPAEPAQVAEPAKGAEPAAPPAVAETVKPAAETPKEAEVAVLPDTKPATEAAPAAPAKAETAPSTPSFDTVRVEATGDAVIAGRADPDSDVTVKWNGNVVGSTKAGPDGSFVVVPEKPLTKGTGALTIEMAKNGAVTTSEGSVIVAVKNNAPALVAKVDPVAPTEVVQTGVDAAAPTEVQLTAVDYDAQGNIVFSGKAKPGSVVRFYVDNAAAGEGVANPAGAWSFQGASAISVGTHTLRADAVDAAGKVLSRIELPFLREAVETVVAAQVQAEPPKVAVAETVVAKTPEPAANAAAAEPAQPAPAAAPAAADTQVAAAPQPAPVEEGPRRLVIQPGNNLWKLSREVYGKGRMYTIIFEANRDQVKNANRIYPGQILTAPKQQ